MAVALMWPVSESARKWRLPLWSAMTKGGHYEAAAVGLLGRGSFPPKEIPDGGRYPFEGRLSWVGIVVRADVVEVWCLERVPSSRPLTAQGSPKQAIRLDRLAFPGADLRADGDRRLPRLWLRWESRGQPVCLEFLPLRVEPLFRRPISDGAFAALVKACAEVVPARGEHSAAHRLESADGV